MLSAFGMLAADPVKMASYGSTRLTWESLANDTRNFQMADYSVVSFEIGKGAEVKCALDGSQHLGR
jgi:hypothetical protein